MDPDLNETLDVLDGQFATNQITLEGYEKTGRLDGQTGWSGVDVNGNKTISYRFAIIVWA